MKRRVSLLGIVLLAASSLQFSCVEPVDNNSIDCTRSSCFSFFTLEFDGVKPGEYSIRYFFGATGQFRNVSCSVALASADCTSEDNVEYDYHNSALTLGISLGKETPDEITVQFLNNGVLREESTFYPEYTPKFFNGPDCGVTCYFIKVESMEVGEIF